MDNISGKRILFFCTKFFSYYEYIQRELLYLGASYVKFVESPNFSESPRKFNSHEHSLAFLYFYLKNPSYRTKWTNELIYEIKGEQFDILFCVADVPFKYFFFEEIKKSNPCIKTYLFLWDKLSVQRVPEKIIQAFDYKFSFDRDDCLMINGLEYLPDFYLNFDDIDDTDIKYDVCIIATLTDAKRGEISMALDNFCKRNGLSSYIYLLSRKNVYKKNIFKRYYGRFLRRKIIKFLEKPGNNKFVHSEGLTAEEVELIQNQSRCIFDFGYRGRQGLTLNAIAALAKGKKLITSNDRIKNENFYNSQNIYIYDYENPLFDLRFFKAPPVPIDMTFLRLDNWLKYILNR